MADGFTYVILDLKADQTGGGWIYNWYGHKQIIESPPPTIPHDISLAKATLDEYLVCS